MAEQSSFFNSVNGDRKYAAEFWADFFAQFIGNGVYTPSAGKLQVKAGPGMGVTITAGYAFINGYMYRNTTDKYIAFDPADGALNRWERIVVRWSILTRNILSVNKTSAPATTPTVPDYTRDGDEWELVLADAYIAPGTIDLLQTDVYDKRTDAELCGIVSGLIDQIDLTEYAIQMEELIENLKKAIEGVISGSSNLLKEEFATNGEYGVVDKAVTVNDGAITLPKLATDTRDAVNNLYTHTAINVLTGTGVNGYFIAAFDGDIDVVSINTENYITQIEGEPTSVTLKVGAPFSFILYGNTINFKTGGVALNYKVVGGTSQPTNPKENTMWVNTDIAIPSKEWGFGVSNPFDAPIIGNVWFKTSDLASIVLPTSKDISEPQRLDVAFIYDGANWISAYSEIYQNGAWHEITDEILYLLFDKAGFERWSAVATAGTVATLVLNDAVSPAEMLIVAQGSGTTSTHVGVDMTDYTTLIYDYLFPVGSGGLSAGIGTTPTSPSPITHTRSDEWQTKEINVSTRSGFFYIIFNLGTTASSPDFGLRNMRLIK